MVERHKKILSMLCRTALAAWEGKDARGRIAAAIVRKNNVISIGINQKKTDPFQAKYGRDEHSIFHHAEIRAIKQAKRLLGTDDLSFYDLYVCRAKWLDDRHQVLSWGSSKPCKGCHSCISNYGVRRVIYSVGHEQFEVME